MEISIPVETAYEDSLNIEEKDADLYEWHYPTASGGNPPSVTFKKGAILHDTFNVYQRTADDIFIGAGDTANGKLGDIGFIRNVADTAWDISYVTSEIGTEVIQQPEEYNPPENLGFGSWNNRYAKLGELNTDNNTWSKAVNGITHSLRFDYTDRKWKYKLSKYVPVIAYDPEKYEVGVNLFTWNKYASLPYIPQGYMNVIADNISQYYEYSQSAPIAYVTIVTGSDGHKYRCGRYRTSSSTTHFYGIQKQITVQELREHEVVVDFRTSCVDGVTEPIAVCDNQSNCPNEWLPKVVFQRGIDLFIRTNTADGVITKDVSTPVFEPLKLLNGNDGWGWTFTRPVAKYAPVDGKEYTFFYDYAPIEYTVNGGTNSFDSIALIGLISDTVEVTFLPSDGSAAIPTIVITPDNKRDVNTILPEYPTVSVVYAPRPIVGSVHLKFNSAYKVRLGGVLLGQSVNAGFTNLEFTNKFNDYSPYEKDQWGNISRIEGVKTNVFTGTVDIEITDYDMINRLLMSIGGSTVILNGSDNKNNSTIDNFNFFAATLVVGRISNFGLKTKLDNKLLSQKATYTFAIEANV